MSLQYGLALVVAWLAFARPAPNAARIQTKEVEYREGGTVLKGFVAWDDDTYFLGNPYYRGLGGAQLAWMFTAMSGHHIRNVC